MLYTNAERSNGFHIICAWATEHGLTLGQIAVDSKPNETIEIPQLLSQLDHCHTIISVDTLGCKKTTGKQITANGGDHTFAMIENHPKLYKSIEFFGKLIKKDWYNLVFAFCETNRNITNAAT
ncbi:ISAs1 family transposase [Rosistilla oblonga]|uniref:ISAs1 family transposase n=1 Tax=Rosistilla oblonga TaxID=2527990 RepID=UPI003A973399